MAAAKVPILQGVNARRAAALAHLWLGSYAALVEAPVPSDFYTSNSLQLRVTSSLLLLRMQTRRKRRDASQSSIFEELQAERMGERRNLLDEGSSSGQMSMADIKEFFHWLRPEASQEPAAASAVSARCSALLHVCVCEWRVA